VASEVFVRGWGGFGQGNTQFNMPLSVAVHRSTVYVTDARNFRVQVFDRQGTYLRTLGRGRGTGNGSSLTQGRGCLPGRAALPSRITRCMSRIWAGTGYTSSTGRVRFGAGGEAKAGSSAYGAVTRPPSRPNLGCLIGRPVSSLWGP
jgi:hypothetical protein